MACGTTPAGENKHITGAITMANYYVELREIFYSDGTAVPPEYSSNKKLSVIKIGSSVVYDVTISTLLPVYL